MSNQHGANDHLSNQSSGQQSLAINPASEVATWRDPEWQRLWLAVESRPWRALAVVPAGNGASREFTVNIAVALSRTGMVHLGSPIQVADATQVPLNQLTPFLDEVRRCTMNGERLLVALPPTESGPICATIAQATDAAILCVLLDKMTSTQASNTIRVIGQSRFLGSAIFRSSPKSQVAR